MCAILAAITIYFLLKKPTKPATIIKKIRLTSFEGTDSNGTGYFTTDDLVNKGTYLNNKRTAVLQPIMKKIYSSLKMNVIDNNPTEEQKNEIKSSYNQIIIYDTNPLINDGITYQDKVSKIIDGYLFLQNQGGDFYDQNNYKGGIMNMTNTKVGDMLYFVISKTV